MSKAPSDGTTVPPPATTIWIRHTLSQQTLLMVKCPFTEWLDLLLQTSCRTLSQLCLVTEWRCGWIAAVATWWPTFGIFPLPEMGFVSPHSKGRTLNWGCFIQLQIHSPRSPTTATLNRSTTQLHSLRPTKPSNPHSLQWPTTSEGGWEIDKPMIGLALVMADEFCHCLDWRQHSGFRSWNWSFNWVSSHHNIII